MATQEQFLSKRQRYQPISLPQDFSDEELARDWTLTEGDQAEIGKYRKSFRLYLAIQLCAVRLYGRFLTPLHDVSPRIANYLGSQLDLPPSLQVHVPEREATYLEHRQHILQYLGFQKFDELAQGQLATWLTQQAQLGRLPDALFPQAEHYLLDRHILLPGPSVLERLIIHSCAAVHDQLFESMLQRLSPALRQALDHLLTVPEGEQRSAFYYLKEYPPAATISSIQSYLQRYQTVSETGIDAFEAQGVSAACLRGCLKSPAMSVFDRCRATSEDTPIALCLLKSRCRFSHGHLCMQPQRLFRQALRGRALTSVCAENDLCRLI